MRAMWRRRLTLMLAAGMAAMLLTPPLGSVAALPERVVMGAGGERRLGVTLPVSAALSEGGSAVARLEEDGGTDLALRAEGAGEAAITFRLLGVLPVRTVRVSVQPRRMLIPGGQSVGVALNTAGVVVVGSSDLGATPSPARLAGLKSGDVIKAVNGVAVSDAKQLTACLAGGQSAHLAVERDGRAMECDVSPAQDQRDGQWRLGAWVRDSTAGVGTLTYYEPDSGRYGALGHAVTDVDTGVKMPVGAGEIYANRVVDVTPGRAGSPGELTGDFLCDAHSLGTMDTNTDFGIFGEMDGAAASEIYPGGLPAALPGEAHSGAATLLTTVEGERVRQYDCEIVRVNERSEATARELVVRITDQSLLSRTGGIVQGMSGSPLIQDGRIIGAITHVMVNDPAMGYGIGIQTMLNASQG